MVNKFLLNIKPREYQEKIFEACKNKNSLVVLPTGIGKTLIALMLTIDRMQKFPTEKVVFLAPTRPLAEQHFNYFKKHLQNYLLKWIYSQEKFQQIIEEKSGKDQI